MIKEIDLAMLPEHATNRNMMKNMVAELLQIDEQRLHHVQILKRSIDARAQQILYRLKLKIYIDETPTPECFSRKYPDVRNNKTVLIIGAGPAGLFAALRCIRNGLKPIILERGKDVQQRRRDLAVINRTGLINPESNYCFGEGGAGTYSDGKLYTRSNKRGDIQYVLQTLVAHGASADILVDARPHIGTNKLPQIVIALRESILNAGGEIHFDCRVVDLMIEANHFKGVQIADGRAMTAPSLILATGHAARDIYHILHSRNIQIVAKAFAMGLRIEHPQSIIDELQYRCATRSSYLPPSHYSLVEQIDRRGVFSFCMCPGGIIAPCATNHGEIVLNGWSPSKRNNPYANAGLVVEIHLADVPGIDTDPFRLLNFQAEIEKRAFEAGGGQLVAPAQRMIDFVAGRLSNDLPRNSYFPGTKSVMLQDILPPFVHESLQKALPLFGKRISKHFIGKGYYTNEAILLGVESRTSSPIKIPRDAKTRQHPQVRGLFPCGEGAGYAGGIVSAAIDGISCADAIMRQ